MVYIPEKMNNEESKLIAGVLVAERNMKIAEARLYAAENRLKKFYNK